MTTAEQAAYLVAEEQRKRILKSSGNKQLALGLFKGSLNIVGLLITGFIALILTIIFWPAAIVFLLFCLVIN